jgi:hypothetical protein
VTYDLRARPVVVLLLLVVVAAAAGWLVLRTRHVGSGAQASTTATAAPRARAARATAVRHHRVARAAQRPKEVAPPSPASGLPASIRRPLAAGAVVVVALYDPRATIDGTAVREARAGAELAGSSFAPIDVRTNAVAALNARYGVIQDPAVLVLRPPGSLVVRIDGFADRDTVAQAAINAAS